MGFFSKLTSGGLMNEIRCDEETYLIWKWRPSNGAARRENAIRWGSSLRVKEGEVAVFVYSHQDGIVQDFIEGPFDGILRTGNLPILADVIGTLYDSGTPFPAEVYYINLAEIIQSRFAVPYFEVSDSRFPDFSVPVAVRGTISFKIGDYHKFIKLHRLSTFRLEDFQHQIRDAVSRYTKDIVANIPASEHISVIQLDSRAELISQKLEVAVSERLAQYFGVYVSGVDVGAIEIDKESDGYRELMSVTKNVTRAHVEAETQDYADRLRIAREEAQYAQRKQTQSANLGAFQIEAQRDIGIAGANAFGQSDKGASGNGCTGFDPATMMTGMHVGAAIGQNLAGAMTGIGSAVVPPPLPQSVYYVAVNGQPSGPYDVSALRNMLANGQITRTSLVWKEGMTGWAPIEAVDGLVFGAMPPIPTE